MSAGPPGAPRVPTLVIDASVASKWFLRDEPHVDAADSLWDEAAGGGPALTAPAQIEVEVVAAIRRAILRERVDEETGRQLVKEWLGEFCPSLKLVPNAVLLADAHETSLRLGVTLFDALYITLADQIGSDLVVADRDCEVGLGSGAIRAWAALKAA
ncbi:MAG: type II toxin-antitoxin system VapC family toxin [Tepidiformaceae bacterium]